MKIKDLLIISLLVAVFVLSLRNCVADPSTGSSQTIIATDTTTQVVPDTGWQRPQLPTSDTVVVVPLDEVRHWRNKYKEVLSELNAIDDTVRSCWEQAAYLKRKLQRAEEGLSSCNLVIETLNTRIEQLEAVKVYSGVDTTANYIHHYRIKSFGILPGGYEYRTDIVQRVVTRNEITTNYVYRKNSVALLAGVSEAGSLFGLQYARTGMRFGVLGQLQVNGHRNITALGGVKVSF